MQKTQANILSKRERDIVTLVGRGLTNQEIADQLWISMRTVKCILHRACVKLGVRSRELAVLKGLRDGAIEVQDMYSIDELAELMATLPPELITTVSKRVEQNLKQSQAEANSSETLQMAK